MDVVDGNAIAGDLAHVLGAEMTTALGTCANCGSTDRLANLKVYQRAPGVVGRCGRCDAVLVVITTIRGIACVDLLGLAALESPA